MQLCLRDQDCFRSERGWEVLLALLPGDRGEPLDSLLVPQLTWRQRLQAHCGRSGNPRLVDRAKSDGAI